ncbi:MAG: FliG C-terminal domain-containing protein [Planctomycetota bacterium]
MQKFEPEQPTMTDNRSIRNIAILLQALPEHTHRALLGQLSSDEKHRVLGEMACMKDVDASEQYEVLSVMHEQLQAETVVADRVESEIRDEIVIGRARLSKKPDPTLRRPEPSAGERTVPRSRTSPKESRAENALDFLEAFGAENVARVLQRETPETIAWVLRAVDALTGSAILEHLDDTTRREALAYCATMKDLDPKVLEMVAGHLRSQLESLAESGTQISSESLRRFEQRGSGFESPRLAASYREDRRSTRSIGRTRLRPTSPPVRMQFDEQPDDSIATERQAESVDRVLTALPPKELCRALGMVTTEEAFLVLCGLPNTTAENALALLPRRTSRKVRSDMRRLGQLQLSDIDAAKLVVAEVALRLTIAPQNVIG